MLVTGVHAVEAKLSLFIAEHCSIMTVNHLTDLCKSCFSDSKCSDIMLKRSKCTAIIKNVWSPYFLKQLVQDLGDNPYSLMIDESTDITVNKMLGVAIRYVSTEQQEVVSTYLGMVQLESATAAAIADQLDELLTKSNIKVKNCIGIGTDNANVMTGINNGVHHLLEKKWNKTLILVRCICHSIQLAVSYACAVLPRHLEFIVKETYGWFSHSTLRQKSYTELYKRLYDKEPLKILNTCETRWLSIFFCY